MALDTSKVLLPPGSSHRHHQARQGHQHHRRTVPERTPQLFLDKDYMVFTGNSEAEVVAEGAQKSSYEETLTPVVGKRFKVQTTTRLSNELQWADDDAKLEIISKIQADQAAAMGRVLDYVVYHAFDPKKKTTLEGFNALAKTAVGVPATDDRVADIDSLAEAVSDEYDINGIALSKTMANELRKIAFPPPASASTRRSRSASRSATSTASRPPRPARSTAGSSPRRPASSPSSATSASSSGGMVRDIWSEIIEYGDPDNTGKDLKGVNQIAYRTEAMYSYAILDPKGASPCSKKSTSSVKASK